MPKNRNDFLILESNKSLAVFAALLVITGAIFVPYFLHENLGLLKSIGLGIVGGAGCAWVIVTSRLAGAYRD